MFYLKIGKKIKALRSCYRIIFTFRVSLSLYDFHGVSKTFYDSAAVDLKDATEKLNFQVRLLNQPKPTQHGVSILYAGELGLSGNGAPRHRCHFTNLWRNDIRNSAL